MDINREIEQIQTEIRALRQQFHRYPELACEEYKTTEMIIEELEKLQIPYKRIDPTGVVGFIGEKGGKVIALRADIDGLPVQEETGLSYTSEISGQMHACGHDGHITGLLGAAKILKKYEKNLTGLVKLIFQPAEENAVGANIVIEQGYLDDVEEVFGVHIFSDIPVGQISIEPGPRMASTDKFMIKLYGKSGHAAKPHLCADTTVAAAAIVMNLQTIVSRRIDPLDDAVLTIGRLQSGTAYNVISGEAVLEGTVRTFSVETEQYIKELLIRIVRETATMYGIEAIIDYPDSAHPPLVNDVDIAKRVFEEAKQVFPQEALQSLPKLMLGEDFANYQKKAKVAFAFVGGGKCDGSTNYLNHHSHFDFDEEAMSNATKMHLLYIKSTIYKENGR